jgi:hypothetical protein
MPLLSNVPAPGTARSTGEKTTMHHLLTKAAAAAAITGLSLGLVACGDDDDDAGGDDVAAYCEYSASLDEGDSLPTDEQLDRLAELAPDEIASQADVVVREIKDQGEAVFADESNVDFFEALEEIEAYEEENCGRDDPDTEEVPDETNE